MPPPGSPPLRTFQRDDAADRAVGYVLASAVVVFLDGADRLNVRDTTVYAPVLIGVGVGVTARLAGVRVGPGARRWLLLPTILVASAFFADVIGRLSGAFDLRQLSGPGASGDLAMLLIIGTFAAIFHQLFVWGPRAAADSARQRGWLPAFAIFLVGVIVRATLFAPA